MPKIASNLPIGNEPGKLNPESLRELTGDVCVTFGVKKTLLLDTVAALRQGVEEPPNRLAAGVGGPTFLT